MPETPSKPVIPRHAASLVIYEQRGTETYVLMGKRAKAHRFLPNVYVFPGGRVDTEDAFANPSSPLPQPVQNLLSQPSNMAHAVAAAAVRETHEETGLIIGKVNADRLVPDFSNLDYIARAITPAVSPIRFNTRFLMIHARHVSGDLGGSGELIDLKWVSVQEAYKMQLVDVTEFVLEEMEKKLSTPVQKITKVPLFTYYRGKPLIRNI
ncbi:MAG: NUDIX domain-containing protein [Sneathiella sp.]|uniref:NUDIX hydrolase n=1 Tax=Sneathiella sp. TaxID=1964365 RepID=UPI0030019AAE